MGASTSEGHEAQEAAATAAFGMPCGTIAGKFSSKIPSLPHLNCRRAGKSVQDLAPLLPSRHLPWQAYKKGGVDLIVVMPSLQRLQRGVLYTSLPHRCHVADIAPCIPIEKPSPSQGSRLSRCMSRISSLSAKSKGSPPSDSSLLLRVCAHSEPSRNTSCISCKPCWFVGGASLRSLRQPPVAQCLVSLRIGSWAACAPVHCVSEEWVLVSLDIRKVHRLVLIAAQDQALLCFSYARQCFASKTLGLCALAFAPSGKSASPLSKPSERVRR